MQEHKMDGHLLKVTQSVRPHRFAKVAHDSHRFASFASVFAKVTEDSHRFASFFAKVTEDSYRATIAIVSHDSRNDEQGTHQGEHNETATDQATRKMLVHNKTPSSKKSESDVLLSQSMGWIA